MNKLRQYIVNWLLWIDCGFNVLLGGSHDETMSSRMGKRTKEDCPVCHYICRLLDKIDPNHCADAVKPDRGSGDVIK